MQRLYVKNLDAYENPEVIDSLKVLVPGVDILSTQKEYQDILDPNPFLYFRNPYIRIKNLASLIDFHSKNTDIPHIVTKNNEVISVSCFAKGNHHFVINDIAHYFDPLETEALPILVGTHERDLYLRLTLNSILHNITSEKVYIVLSKPNNKVIELVKEYLTNYPDTFEAVISEGNLYYSFINFGAKFFNLSKFILFEEDVILPESLNYHMPYWTKQFNYRSTVADLVSFRVSGINYTTGFLKCDMYKNNKLLELDNKLWFFSKTSVPGKLLPIGGGMGSVISSEKMLKNIESPNYWISDSSLCQTYNNIFIANVPVYHIGVNEVMDYPGYYQNKKQNEASINVNRFQKGTNLRTNEVKTIDLACDWSLEA